MNVLILLIGGNPLPNYVVAHYLLKPDRPDTEPLPRPDNILLVYSNDTEPFAGTIEETLEKHPSGATIWELSLGSDERVPDVIRNKIYQRLNKIVQDTSSLKSLHLNYTGGTKPMSVWSSLAIAQWLKDKRPDMMPILSDLDPQNHKIICNRLEDSYPLGTEDLRGHVKLSINELLTLHGMCVDDAGIIRPVVPKDELNRLVAYALPLYEKKLGKTIFHAFHRAGLQVNGRTNGEKAYSIEKQLDKFQQGVNEIQSEFSDWFEYFQALEYPKLAFYEFFQKNAWLEHSVLQSVADLHDEQSLQISDFKMGIRASRDGRETEIDVMAVRGYQLFLMSCTTDHSITEVKRKVFEALYRAEELGGEHAKSLMISRMQPGPFSGWEENNIEELRKDLQQFRAIRNCFLIGRDVLERQANGEEALKQRLREIISGERKEDV